ncbi:tRNA pseudouridine(55) synthase TruB [Chloroflexia bacterium SDU3-3]|nr:tRNA pseudouridine(55) synthase TruB [Chloroflexia bacterium SDU3-3]
MHGFLNIDKPAGMTSHDVVARLRRLARQKRVGHAGTLDPAATGVLVVALGQATRLIEYVQDETRKSYRATVRLGATTTTDDAEGEVGVVRPVPALAQADLAQALAPFQGHIQQVPPMYSALHHEGQRLYDLARAGVTLDLPARPVVIYQIDLVELRLPDVVLDITCGKGTYIRSIARDLGAALGCGAHLAALRRTAVGTFVVAQAATLEALEQGQPALAEVLLPAEHAVRDWPAVALDAEQAAFVRNGRPLLLPDAPAGERARAHGPGGELLATLQLQDGRWQPTKVFQWDA